MEISIPSIGRQLRVCHLMSFVSVHSKLCSCDFCVLCVCVCCMCVVCVCVVCVLCVCVLYVCCVCVCCMCVVCVCVLCVLCVLYVCCMCVMRVMSCVDGNLNVDERYNIHCLQQSHKLRTFYMLNLLQS